MSDEIMTPEPQETTPPEPWLNIWIDALTKPSVETFEWIAESPHANTRTAYNWVFIASAIGVAVTFLLGQVVS